MNNAVFNKTMENVRDRVVKLLTQWVVDVKLLTQWESRYGADDREIKFPQP